MKLSNKLKELDENELVYIGARSAFVFIGYPQEFILKEKELNKKWKRYFEKAKNLATITYANCLSSPPDKETKITRREFDLNLRRPVDRIVPYEVLEKEWKEKCNALKVSKETATKRFEKFKSFKDRDVIECYRSIDGTATKIIIRGYESAPYWLHKEYLNADKKGH